MFFQLFFKVSGRISIKMNNFMSFEREQARKCARRSNRASFGRLLDVLQTGKVLTLTLSFLMFSFVFETLEY